MPLSEHEQKMLDQLEQQLAEDTHFATQMSARPEASMNKVRIALGAVAVVAGLGIVVAGVATQLIWLGVIGFVVMVLGGYLVATPRHGGRSRGHLRSVGPDGSLRTPRAGGRPTRSSTRFMDRLAARWEQRRRDGQL